MKMDLEHLLESVPESILLYDPEDYNVVMTNTEMQKTVH